VLNTKSAKRRTQRAQKKKERVELSKKIPRYVRRIVGIKQEKEGGKRQKPKGASKR
jgi:hypothetical protein